MPRSETTGALAAALASAQAAFLAVAASRTAKIKSRSGAEFTYGYADLSSIIAATRPALAANGLAVAQLPRVGERSIVVATMLLHSSGEWISEEMEWPVDFSDPRSIGSGITYARRYGYTATVGVAVGDEDDDGQAARGGNHERSRPQTPAPRPSADGSGSRRPAGKPKADEVTTALTRDIEAHFTRLGIAVDGRKAETERLLGRRPKTGADLAELARKLAGLAAPDQRSSEQMGGA